MNYKPLLAACLMVSSAMAQKTVYIPDEWKNPWPSDSLLYKESDPGNQYTWSKSRSKESDNVVVFWDKYYGNTSPGDLPVSDFYHVDIDDLLEKCEAFYDLEINRLGFVDPVSSNLSKYKVMVLLNHTTEWTCYGAGYDYEVSALWLNPSTCKPVGHSVAHEVGHSFHYMCYAEACGHNHTSSTTIGTGFHLALNKGQAIWEQTAQWQANQSYPEEMFNQSIGTFRRSHNYAFSHEWHRYQSYWMHYYLCQHYDDITTVAQVWNQPMTGAVDFNQALMALKGLSPRDLYKLYFDYACRLVTWDLDACVPYRDNYIGDFDYRCSLNADSAYQVAMASCPQGTGFNVIPLKVPQTGTEVACRLTALTVGSALASDDPGEYLNGSNQYTKVTSRRYIDCGTRSTRGFRMGFVALMQDGSRRYFSEDSVYCKGTSKVTERYGFTMPEGVSRLWLVVSPALSRYYQHRWDDQMAADDQWPYAFRLEGTGLGPRAVVYSAPTLDGRDVADATFTYDVSFPKDNQYHSGASLTLSGQADATLGTAFQMPTTQIASLLEAWTAQGPTEGHIMFYGVGSNGQLARSGSTANGYGHWFNANGNVCAYSYGYVFSEFDPNSMTFSLGQYPGKCQEGHTYTIRQALRYRQSSSKIVQATFVFNITVGPYASATLSSIDYSNPSDTPVRDVTCPKQHPDGPLYDLQGRACNSEVRGDHHNKGLYIQNGRKHIKR